MDKNLKSTYIKMMEDKEDEEIRWNNRLLKVIHRNFHSDFYEGVLDAVYDLEFPCAGKLSFSASYRGLQDDSDDRLGSYYIDQYGSEDYFYGNVYIKLKENKYLKIPY